MVKKKEAPKEEILAAAYEEYRKELVRYASCKVKNREINEDLVQVAFMKTWSYLMRDGKIELMKAFLYHVLNDLIIDEYRKNKSVSLDVLLDKGFKPSGGDSDRLFGIIDGKDAALLIDMLPEKYQNVMRMRYIQELSLQEIALITGQSKNTIAVQIYRGLRRLRTLYSKVNTQQLRKGVGDDQRLEEMRALYG